MKEQEKRTEYIGLTVTPSLYKQLKEADNNEELKDKLLKQFVTNETDWLKEEILNMDEITVQYRAKLLTIKDNFAKTQDVYVEEIEKLLNKTYEALNPLSGKFQSLKREVESVKSETESTSRLIENLSSKIGYINYSSLEKLLDAMDRFNNMGESEKELIKLLLAK